MGFYAAHECKRELSYCFTPYVESDICICRRFGKMLRVCSDYQYQVENGAHPCSLKGPTYEAGTRLQAASGLHHLIGNHWHVLVRITLVLPCFNSYTFE
jgi:hypothetical protein